MDPILELQRVDTAIDRNDHRRKVLEGGAELRAVREEMERAESVLGEIRLALDEVAREQGRLEHEVDTMDRKSEAEKKRLYDGSVANPKELESLQREVDAIAGRKARVEDELLAVLERREELDGRASAASTEVDAARARADALGGEAVEELARLASEREGLAAERVTAAAAVEPELLALYDDLRAHKQGVGAAALVDGVCQACRERLSAMELDRLKRSTDVKRCEHCRRILVLG